MHLPLWSQLKPALLCSAAIAIIAGTLHAAPAPAAPPVNTDTKPILKAIELKAGDTLVFLGDSITHQCLYTQYLEDYFYTRYPKLKLRFHNSGVGGDRGADALRRFEEDVAAFQPKYVTILLGMNDGLYRDFDKATFDTYQADMGKVLDRIAAIGAIAVPMTPTMHDARAARMSKRGPAEPRDTYYNGVLALYGAWLREQAHVRGLGFVDMYSPLNNLTLQERKTKPDFTMIKDAVHPDAPGQVVMATAILSDMIPRSSVSGLNGGLNPRGAFTVTGANGKVSDVKESDNGVSFTFAANALPWVLPAEAAEGFKLTKAGHRYSNEKLTLRNLPPGKYDVRIDGELVGTYTDALLARGVELQENAKTPQYQQALAVAMLNQERNDKAMRPLRNLWRDLKLKERAIAAAPNDPTKKQALDDWKPTFTAKVAEMQALVLDYEKRIYEINQPKPRRYEITPAK